MTATTTFDHPARARTRRAPGSAALGAGRAGFRQALAFEWTKFRSARATSWTLAATAILVPAFAVFVGATGSLQPDDTILGGSLTGSVGVQMVATVLGALAITTEHSSGMIRTTLAAQPRRLTVLAAKGAVVFTTLFAVTSVSCTLAFGIGLVMIDGDVHATGDPWPALPGIALMLSVSGLLGLAVGTVLRRSAGAVAAVAGVTLLPSLLGPLFGDLQRWVGGASPSSALEKLTQTSDATHETVGSLGGWPSLAIVAAYTAAALVGSAWLLRARDV
jgi:ABC-2 type transport system permease protein